MEEGGSTWLTDVLTPRTMQLQKIKDPRYQQDNTMTPPSRERENST